MKSHLLWILILALFHCTAFGQSATKPSPPEVFNPEVASVDLEEIRRHISGLENKILLYRMMGSLPSQITGIIIAAMGGIDFYSIYSASQADLFVIRQASLYEEQGAVGLGRLALEKGGRLAGFALFPTKISKFFTNLSTFAFEKGSQILIINSKILSGGVTLSGVTWYFFSIGLVPTLIKYNQIELSMLRAYAASLATEEENLTKPEVPKK